MEWKDIESAPKDGTRIILFWPSYSYGLSERVDNPVIDVGWWTCNTRLGRDYHNPDTGELVFRAPKSDDYMADIESKGIYSPAYFTNSEESDCYGQAQAHNAPTHWMPLPPHPNKEG